MARERFLTIGVADLLRHPGELRRVRRSVELPELAISSASVPPGGEIDLDLQIEALGGGVIVTGSVTAPWTGECRRCLGPVGGTVSAMVREIYERNATEGETYSFAGDEIDIEPMVRDAVLLVLPIAPLCSDDCLGPAPDVFPAAVEDDSGAVPVTGGVVADDGGDESDEADERDSRWAALDQITFDD